jgi:methionyl aminopeptidase
MIQIKSKEDIAGMRAAGRLAAEVLNKVGEKVRKGINTLELNDYVDKITTEAGAISAPYQYKTSPTESPFPKHCCTSPNNVVCHGIPSDKVWLSKRDILNVDITVILDGYHGDTSRTFFAGKPKPEVKKLVDITQQAMYKGIEAVKPGGCISDIGKAIEEFVKPYKYGIVEQLTGHGIGKKFHEEPAVYHYYNPNFKLKLIPGMIFTVEPMLNMGTKEIGLLEDGWTIVTKDGKWSAQFEHTVLVTEDGVEILTKV